MMQAKTEQSETSWMDRIKLIEGDILDQSVDVIVNAWNRNIIPWRLLLPQGVSGAIKRRAGSDPFIELGRCGPIPLGQAVITGAGRLPYKGIIHVAGISMLWRASEQSVRDSVTNALRVAVEHDMESIAMPLIGSGSGGFRPEQAQSIMLDQLRCQRPQIKVFVVTYRKGRKS